jgi:hypothetical protein
MRQEKRLSCGDNITAAINRTLTPSVKVDNLVMRIV